MSHKASCRCVECEAKQVLAGPYNPKTADAAIRRLLREYRKAMRLMKWVRHQDLHLHDMARWRRAEEVHNTVGEAVAKWRGGGR